MGAGGFGERLGVVVHHGYHAQVGLGHQGAGVVRAVTAVEEDQVARLRPDDRAVPVDRINVCRGRIMGDGHFAAAGRMVGTEEHAAQGVGVDVGLEAHGPAPLNVEDDAVPRIGRWRDRLWPGMIREVEKDAVVEALQPGDPATNLMGVDPATVNA